MYQSETVAGEGGAGSAGSRHYYFSGGKEIGCG